MKIEKPKPFVLKRKALNTLTGILKQDANGTWIIDWDVARDLGPLPVTVDPQEIPHVPLNPIWVDPYNIPINPYQPYDANPLHYPIMPSNPVIVPNNPINPPVMPEWNYNPNYSTGTWITPTWTHTTTDNVTVTYTNGTTSGSEVINDYPLYDLTLTYNVEP